MDLCCVRWYVHVQGASRLIHTLWQLKDTLSVTRLDCSVEVRIELRTGGDVLVVCYDILLDGDAAGSVALLEGGDGISDHVYKTRQLC